MDLVIEILEIFCAIILLAVILLAVIVIIGSFFDDWADDRKETEWNEQREWLNKRLAKSIEDSKDSNDSKEHSNNG